ncbi:MAG TPA: NADH-quinone oxidoreductase subunit NuoG [Thermoanaerobaculia bacterium]|nr:NADH-quinone oxidoreductase subunit NuoG [Thermoanaerobaculia bacterium]
MAEIHIDGKRHEADPSRNLLEVCLGLGYDLPYFCWHPALGSVGACRQCAVKQFRDEADERGILVMACMTPAAEGTRISIADPDARELRRSVVEWLMVNHPHDCPVCDEGGECHLQDMTVMTGHHHRRYRFTKKTYRNQDLGPLINHEMNRCIQCYRCVRFYDDYAGGSDLQVLGAHDHVYFGRHEDGPLESELAGNLVEVCPTGVFTDKSLKRHYTRKWDLMTAPSVCVHCSLGCNTTPGERYGELRRIRNRYHSEVNGYFLCDRGRYGYEFVNHERRLRTPLLREHPGGGVRALAPEQALDRLAALLEGATAVIGIGSPRASLEANFALRRLVGADRFHRGVDAGEAALLDAILSTLRAGPARTPSLRDVERCDAVLVLGEDVPDTAPMLGLALRQSVRQAPLVLADERRIPRWHDAAVRDVVQDRRGPLFLATPAGTRLDELATAIAHAAPEAIARIGHAVAHRLDPSAPPVPDLDDRERAFARDCAQALAGASRPLVVSGAGCASLEVIEAAATVARALCRRHAGGELVYVVPECNSLGLALIGGDPLEAALARVESGAADVVIVLENDLVRRLGEDDAERLLAAPHVVVLDHLATRTGERAELVLPAATFAEADGTLVSNEGRAQRHYRVFVPAGEVRESWRWLSDALARLGRPRWAEHDDLAREMAGEIDALRPLLAHRPDADERFAGARLPRALHRYSGRTAMSAHREVHEPKPPEDAGAPYNFSMEGFWFSMEGGRAPARLAAEFWAPGWNSIQALNRFQEEISGPLRGGDPGVRLLEPVQTSAAPHADHPPEIPPPFVPSDDTFRLVPLHHVFGSEELSSLSPGIAELAPEPYLALSPADAARFERGDGPAIVAVALDGRRLELPLRELPELPPGVAGVPRGLPGLVTGPLPELVRLEPVAPREREP